MNKKLLLFNKLIKFGYNAEDIQKMSLDKLEKLYFLNLTEKGIKKHTILYPKRTAFNSGSCVLCNEVCQTCGQTILINKLGFGCICCKCIRKLDTAKRKVKA